jgi:hypothetical protein
VSARRRGDYDTHSRHKHHEDSGKPARTGNRWNLTYTGRKRRFMARGVMRASARGDTAFDSVKAGLDHCQKNDRI